MTSEAELFTDYSKCPGHLSSEQETATARYVEINKLIREILIKIAPFHSNSRIGWCLMNSQPTCLFFNQFKLNELWPYYQKHVNVSQL